MKAVACEALLRRIEDSRPALFLLKDGEVVDAWTGYAPRAAVKQRLEQHVGKIGA